MDEKPEKSKGDLGYALSKAAISSIPIIGGAASEIFTWIVTPPLEKRRIQWIESIIESLNKLEDQFKEFKIENLQKDEQFITAISQATRSALRNHQDEKLDALKNAVLNVAIRNEPDEDLQLIFLNYIDDLTPWHLRILSFYKNPNEWFVINKQKIPDISMGAPSHALYNAFPEIIKHGSLINQIIADLNTRGLLDLTSIGGSMTQSGIFAKRTTEMGDRFLKFIASPIKK